MTEVTTGYTIIGPEGIYSGHSRQRYPHTIATDALLKATGAPWQQIEYREIGHDASGSVWDVEGTNGLDDRSGLYRLTIGDPITTEGTKP